MHTTIRSGLAGAAALTLAVLTPVATASAQSSGETVITNTETVNVTLDPSGEVDIVRFYDQIAIQGSGDVEYSNPVSTQGLRNLDEFGGFTVEGDAIVESTSVDGQQRRRALADFDKELPITISATYSLDGQPIDPADLVGKSGTVEAVFTVENMTGAEEEITYPDGTGGTVTETAMVYDPYGGSLAFTLPPNFTDVTSDDGFVTAGDGRGGTLMNYGITFVSGLTEPVAEVSYTATVTDAVVPPVTLSVLPVVVEDTPSATAQLAALQGGVESGQELASNGELLDESVLALASGAAELVNGIIQLDEGAAALSAGLVQAAPGAAQIADGLNELNGQVPALVDGVGQLDSGGTELAVGLNQLDAQVPALVSGVSQLNAGGQQVAAGATALNNGLAELSAGVEALPQVVQDQLQQNEDYQLLLGTLTSIINGIGTPEDTTSDTLLGGLNLVGGGIEQIKGGLRWPGGYSDTDCDLALAGQEPSQCGAMDAVQFIAGALQQGATGLDQLKPAFQALNAALGPAACATPPPPPADFVPPPIPADPPATPCDLLGTIYYGLFAPGSGAQAQVQAAAGALGNVYNKVDSDLIAAGIDAQLLPGVASLKKALFNEPCNPQQTDSTASDFCGISQALVLIQQGIPELVDQLVLSIQQTLQAGIGAPTAGCVPEPGQGGLRCGSAALAAGAAELSDGLAQLNGQTGPLSSGVDQLASGANQLSVGLGELNAQTGPLSDGVNQLADGANQLAPGLAEAADGSVQLSEGLGDAAEAGPALPQGAQRLSEEGTSQLVEAGEDTAQSFGERVALIQAAAERTADGGLPYGGPQDAIVAAAYRYDLAAADGATAQNTGQLVAGLVIAGGAVAGATVLARRKTA